MSPSRSATRRRTSSTHGGALHASGTPILYEADRAFTKSLHVLDPDGNEIELYIDTSDEWKAHTPDADA
jgi:catechol-2,3-dioxygenase